MSIRTGTPMSVGAAIRITSPGQNRVIDRAAAFAQQLGEQCYVISIVRELPHGAFTDEEREIVRRNLDLITARNAAPIMQEGKDIPNGLLAVARAFGVRTLFVQGGHPHLLGRSIAEQLLYLRPPFEVVVISQEE